MKKLFSFPSYLKKCQPRSESGLTLIECLVAISVIAATSATIAPVMVLSVATRVQNQKTEQALQLARGEIDRVRLLVERNSVYTDADLKLAVSTEAPLPTATTPDPALKGTAIADTEKPTSLASKAIWSADTYTPDAYKAREIDTNGDGDPDFVIQSFRGGAVPVPVTITPDTGGTPTSYNMPAVFDMGVRVYDYAAITQGTGSIPATLTLETEPAGLAFTSGEGQRGRRPLAVLYSQITNSDNSQSLCEYMTYLRKPIPSTMSCG